MAIDGITLRCCQTGRAAGTFIAGKIWENTDQSPVNVEVLMGQLRNIIGTYMNIP